MQLIRTVNTHAAAIDRWLNTFASGQMSEDAAAFMYLAQGFEEIRD